MRTIIVVIFLIIYLLLQLPTMGILWIYRRFQPEKADLAQLETVRWGFYCIMFLSGVKTTVIGRENIPENESVLYIGNHRSIFDIVCLYPLVRGRCGFVAKTSVKKVPILNLIMKRLHCLFIDRSDMKQSLKVILEAIDSVKEGISIAIFPEGTRGKGADETEVAAFKEGSFKIATKTGCKIIPVAISGTRGIFEEHFPDIRGRKVVISFGKPIDPKELDKEQQKKIGEYVRTQIVNMLQK